MLQPFNNWEKQSHVFENKDDFSSLLYSAENERKRKRKIRMKNEKENDESCIRPFLITSWNT